MNNSFLQSLRALVRLKPSQKLQRDYLLSLVIAVALAFLVGAGILLLEGLRLAHVPEGVYLLSALPLNLGGCEGAPCRAYLIPLP